MVKVEPKCPAPLAAIVENESPGHQVVHPQCSTPCLVSDTVIVIFLIVSFSCIQICNQLNRVYKTTKFQIYIYCIKIGVTKIYELTTATSITP